MTVAPKRHEMGKNERLIRRSNESSLKEINPEFSLEGLMLAAEAPILWPPVTKN